MIKTKYKNWRLETDENNIIWCYLDRPGSSTNVLSSEVLSEFGEIVENVETNKPRGLIILSAKDSGFIAGADVSEFTVIESRQQALEVIRKVHGVLNRLERLAFPTLALINGYCLGGGLELALACRYRLVLDEPNLRLGLPEVLLGIHPGFGGSMRMIRLLGAVQAMQLMLAGRTVNPRTARKIGLVDRVVPLRQFRNAAAAMILKSPPNRRPGFTGRLANTVVLRPLLAWYFRKELHKRIDQKNYPAPYALVDLWERYGSDEKTMLEKEAESVADLIVTGTSRNLVRVFQLQEQLKNTGKDTDYNPQHVHVIGAGVMGGDIAAWCVLKGFTVTLQDREPKYIAAAIKRAYQLFKKKIKLGHAVTAAMDRLVPDLKGYGIAKADIVIEAIIENLDAKAGLFTELEAKVRPDAVLATNTSSIGLDEINIHLQNPDRLVGIHFFNPVARMQLVEIVHSSKTADEWLTRAAAFCRKIDRLPLPVKSSPGFLVNRILTPYLLETVAICEEGIPIQVIDKAAKDFGMPMGPVELADTVGLDICLNVAKNMAAKLNVKIPDVLQKKVKKGELGKKSGKGFYQYKNGKPVKRPVDTEIEIPADLVDRLVMRILNECAACLREVIVTDGDKLDAGMIFGTGFAPFRGGPMHYARTLGYDEVIETLITLEIQHGDRFKPDTAWQEFKADV